MPCGNIVIIFQIRLVLFKFVYKIKNQINKSFKKLDCNSILNITRRVTYLIEENFEINAFKDVACLLEKRSQLLHFAYSVYDDEIYTFSVLHQ